MRWGVWSLVFAKFVPGFAIVGPPIAGALGLPLFRFLTAAAVGAFLWAGGAMLLGYAMRVEVRWLMGAIDDHGGTAVAVVTGTVGAWLTWKLLRRRHFQRTKDVRFIAAEDLMTEMDSAQPPLLIDLRGPARSLLEGPLRGATAASLDTLAQAVEGVDRQRLIVTLCACPQDATAMGAARVLAKQGYRNVRALRDGGAFVRSTTVAAGATVLAKTQTSAP